MPLLITDMIMPVMTDRDLAAKLQREHPALNCLFISGYAEASAASDGSSEGEQLQKPSHIDDLRGEVRALLDVRPAQRR